MNTGPPGPAGSQPYPGGLPMGYYGPQLPSTFALCPPAGGTYPIQYQPGQYPAPTRSAPITWMPGPTPMPGCPPGLEYFTQVLDTKPARVFQWCGTETEDWVGWPEAWVSGDGCSGSGHCRDDGATFRNTKRAQREEARLGGASVVLVKVGY